jgi:hypothetical protein
VSNLLSNHPEIADGYAKVAWNHNRRPAGPSTLEALLGPPNPRPRLSARALAALRWRLSDGYSRSRHPILICHDENKRLWPGQSRLLLDRLLRPRETVTQPGGAAHVDAVLDWLSGVLG